MRILPSVLFLVSSAFAYQVTDPSTTQGWTTSGPNQLVWERVDTDPATFAVFLTNVNNGNNNQLLASVVNGSLGSMDCSPPSGGWPTGSGFRVNLAQDASHPDALLAQSNQFNITATGSSTQSTLTSTGSTRTTASAATGTGSSASSSDTSTTPTGTSAALPRADARTGSLTAIAALAALAASLF